MGSLVSGWDSPRSGGMERRKSFTEENIESFWKMKREAEEKHLGAVIETVPAISEHHNLPNLTNKLGGKGNQSFPANRPARLEISKSFTERVTEDTHTQDGGPLSDKKVAWWTRSNWAFLNEPPQSEMDGHAYKYTTQHNVAIIGKQKQNLSPDLMASTY